MRNREFWQKRHAKEMGCAGPYAFAEPQIWKTKLNVLSSLELWVSDNVYYALQCLAANDKKMAIRNLDRAIKNFDFLMEKSAFSTAQGNFADPKGEALAHIAVRWAKAFKGEPADDFPLIEAVRLMPINQASLGSRRDDKEEWEFCQFIQLASAFLLEDTDLIGKVVERTKTRKKYRWLEPEINLLLDAARLLNSESDQWEKDFRPLFDWWRSPEMDKKQDDYRRHAHVFGWGFWISLLLAEITYLVQNQVPDWSEIAEAYFE